MPSLIDAEAASQRLGVPKSWVAAEARANRIPHVRLGKYVRFDVEALDAWWRARLQGPVVPSKLDPESRGRNPTNAS